MAKSFYQVLQMMAGNQLLIQNSTAHPGNFKLLYSSEVHDHVIDNLTAEQLVALRASIDQSVPPPAAPQA